MNKLDEILTLDDRLQAFYHVVDYYLTVSQAGRERVREGWDFKTKWLYPNQYTLAIRISDDKTCEERINASLVYYSLSDMQGDVRDNLIGLALIYHSALEVGMDVNKLFMHVIEKSSEKTSSILTGFINREDKDLSLGSFRLEKHKVDNGIKFKSK